MAMEADLIHTTLIGFSIAGIPKAGYFRTLLLWRIAKLVDTNPPV